MEKKEKKTARSRAEIRQALADRKNGRDEMNLAELPIFLLSTRAPSGIYELEFELEEFDPKLKQRVRRKLTVTAGSKFGLPTSAAEELCLGLLHVTKACNDFADPRVYFSRRELLKTLSWPTTGPSYKRLARCMGQIANTRLHCENYWRDNRSKEYRSVENVSIIDYYRFRDSGNPGDGSYDEYLSEFRWGAAMFDSFDAGYLKKLDLEVALSLGTTARRLYRFLDKRFHPPRRTRLVYDLQPFAFERIGMSRAYDTTQIRRQLKPAIAELVRAEFLKPLPPQERFLPKEGCWGHWQVVFEIHPTSVGSVKERLRRSLSAQNGSRTPRPASNRPEHQIIRASDIL